MFACATALMLKSYSVLGAKLVTSHVIFIDGSSRAGTLTVIARPLKNEQVEPFDSL